MTVAAVVREWRDDEGCGVLDSAETPGGCWTFYGNLSWTDGYRTLDVGATVALDWEAGRQDGCDYRAVRVWDPVVGPFVPAPAPVPRDPPAFSSTLTLSTDDGRTVRIAG